MTTLSQKAFSGGELSPSLYARTDIQKYYTGLRTLRNMYVMRHGGATNRPGTKFIGESKYSTRKCRLIEFVFNDEDTFIIEMGHEYFRFIKNDSYIKEAAKSIEGITQANPAVVTITGHGYQNGDEVFINGVQGMLEVNNRNFIVTNATANTFELSTLDNVGLDSTSYGLYSGSGSTRKIYEVVTNYIEEDLFDIKFVQSADVLTFANRFYPPQELKRYADDDWELTEIEFKPGVERPTGLSAVKGPAGSKTFRYKVTAVDPETFEESLAALNSVTRNITNATQTNPVVITSNAHGYQDGDEVYIKDVVGMEELNGQAFIVVGVTANTFELEGIDGSLYGAYVSGGTINATFVEITAAADGTSASPHVISWTSILGIAEYNVYQDDNGIYGLLGIAGTNSFNDIGVLPDLTETPPLARNPFIGEGNYPATVTYIQQRLAFASTDNDPEKIWMSKTANFKNFTTSSPLQADDAVTFTMVGRQVNEVRNMVDLGRLIILTSGGEWTANGNDAGIITPTEINSRQYGYSGSATLAPVIIGGDALFLQARGSIIRDLAYNSDVEGYRGNDLTIFSSHLFDKYQINDWSYQQIPNSILWCVRNDGILLGLTMVRDQQMLAWHRHDFEGGTVESVATIPRGNEDFIHVVVNRVINGRVTRYIERMTTRFINDIKDLTLLDSNISYDGRNTNSLHTMTLSGGVNWDFTEDLILTSSDPIFASTDIGNAIHMQVNGVTLRCSITAFSSSTVVTVKANRTVPDEFRDEAISEWSKAVDQLLGLWHLEGKSVSVFADGFVVANPNNGSYDVVTVQNGSITLDRPYSVIHVGLPYTSDFETLDVDSPQGETLMDKRMLAQEVNLFVEASRGIFAGVKAPIGADPLEGLVEYKLRDTEGYDDPVALRTGKISVNIKGEWNNNGRVFVRQIDPIPMTILAIAPSGYYPIR